MTERVEEFDRWIRGSFRELTRRWRSLLRGAGAHAGRRDRCRREAAARGGGARARPPPAGGGQYGRGLRPGLRSPRHGRLLYRRRSAPRDPGAAEKGGAPSTRPRPSHAARCSAWYRASRPATWRRTTGPWPASTGPSRPSGRARLPRLQHARGAGLYAGSGGAAQGPAGRVPSRARTCSGGEGGTRRRGASMPPSPGPADRFFIRAPHYKPVRVGLHVTAARTRATSRASTSSICSSASPRGGLPHRLLVDKFVHAPGGQLLRRLHARQSLLDAFSLLPGQAHWFRDNAPPICGSAMPSPPRPGSTTNCSWGASSRSRRRGESGRGRRPDASGPLPVLLQGLELMALRCGEDRPGVVGRAADFARLREALAETRWRAGARRAAPSSAAGEPLGVGEHEHRRAERSRDAAGPSTPSSSAPTSPACSASPPRAGPVRAGLRGSGDVGGTGLESLSGRALRRRIARVPTSSTRRCSRSGTGRSAIRRSRRSSTAVRADRFDLRRTSASTRVTPPTSTRRTGGPSPRIRATWSPGAS